eukprot:TRINITY_DN1424_c0_g3_i1.p1 TRINITY_DN1424_c0_g3~~TRINITY_DN1424_c0_g3_i1.p1  ORF type:complete len:170 (-),score=24.40 TRINITY_DN1424_c0_g3_i1:69-578(-)
MEVYNPVSTNDNPASQLDFTSWLLTINTNKVYSEITPPVKERFEQWFMFMLGKQNIDRFIHTFFKMVPYSIVDGKKFFDWSDSFSPSFVKYNAAGAMELSKKDLLHNHTSFKLITHKEDGAALLFDLDRFRSLFRSTFSYNGHVDIKFKFDPSLRMWFYSQKTLQHFEY